MKRLFLIGTVLCLTACGTTVETFHNACMDAPVPFAQQVACVKDNVAQDPYLADDTLVREYLLTGDMLAGQVARGEITEEAARLQFLRTLNNMRQDQLNRDAARARIQRDTDRLLPRRTECYPAGDRTICTTF